MDRGRAQGRRAELLGSHRLRPRRAVAAAQWRRPYRCRDQTAILNCRTSCARSSAVVASSWADDEISWADALVCSVEAETCSAEAEEDCATSATWTMSLCI